jgi:hypothetical protein
MSGMIGPYKMDGVAMPSWLLRFDKDGACTAPETRQALLDHLRSEPRTDIIFFSHGWNNDFDDATKLYAEFLRSWEALRLRHVPPRSVNPLFVGVLWPSVWLSFSSGPAIAAHAAAAAEPASDALLATLAERGVDESSRDRVREFLARSALSQAEAAELAQLVAPAFGPARDDDGTGIERETRASDLVQLFGAMQRVTGGAPPGAGDPDDWGETPTDVAAGGTAGGDAPPVQSAGLLSALDPRMALRLFSVYQMKDRAGSVGYHGVAALLRDVMHATAERATPVHAVGHSYGCKVVLSAICAPTHLPRPVRSLLLLQPAVSHLAFADQVPGSDRAGGYRLALDETRVQSPIYSTYSSKDIALHKTFHLALRRHGDLGEASIAADTSTSAGPPPSRFAALGGYGPRRAGQVLIDPLPPAGAPYAAAPPDAAIVAFDGSQGQIRGHGDITGEGPAWALHQLMFR